MHHTLRDGKPLSRCELDRPALQVNHERMTVPIVTRCWAVVKRLRGLIELGLAHVKEQRQAQRYADSQVSCNRKPQLLNAQAFPFCEDEHPL